MLYRIKIELYRIRKFISRSRTSGMGLPYILLLHLPKVFINLFYGKLAKRFNDRVLAVTINRFVMRKFHKQHPNLRDGSFYVIVMPKTLHYLIPCLRLLPPDLKVFLVFNGTESWERELIRSEFPDRPTVKLNTLPRSSINHGAVINLFFDVSDHDFGIIDHDLYIFDKTIFDQLAFNDDQVMKAIFKGENRFTGMCYPHTFFLYFNARKLKNIMSQYHVDARIYKTLSSEVEARLATLGLSKRVFIKDYINFYDTLHVLLALAYADGLKVDYMDKQAIYHIGGTSMGSQYAKDASHKYMSMCFLEYVNNPLLTNKYLSYLAPFTSSEQIKAILPRTREVKHMQQTLQKILGLLERHAGCKKTA